MDANGLHERLHELLRGERAAVDSYEKAIRDVRDHSPRHLLASVLENHRRAANVLGRHLDRPARGARASEASSLPRRDAAHGALGSSVRAPILLQARPSAHYHTNV